MPHQVSCYERVITIRLEGKVTALELVRDIRATLDEQEKTSFLTVLVDVTLADAFDSSIKSMLYRTFQHPRIKRIGICGVNSQIHKDVTDFANIMTRVRPVMIAATEADLRAEFGLLARPKKLEGMLAYLKKA